MIDGGGGGGIIGDGSVTQLRRQKNTMTYFIPLNSGLRILGLRPGWVIVLCS